MTIASAIQNAQTKVANCYTSVETMGGTLPEVQNLSNLPTAIESISGGGDTILAYNATGSSLSQGDKVLVKHSVDATETKSEFTIDATGSVSGGQTYVQPCWFTNNLFCVFAGFNGTNVTGSFAYTNNGNGWNKTAITGNHNIFTTTHGAFFRYVDGKLQIVSLTTPSLAASYNRYSINASGTVDTIVGDGYSRLGKINNNTWDSKYSSGSGHDSGIYANGTRLTTQARTLGHYLDITNKAILYSEQTVANISILGNDEASISTTYSSGDISTKAFIGCTGLGVGDYVFFAADETLERWNNMSNSGGTAPDYTYGTVESSYSVYKIDSGHLLQPITADDPLYGYMNIDKSLWRFDNRNNCLVIGTTSNVYVLEFDGTTWTLIASDMELPDNESGAYIYNASLSPDKTKLAVYAGDTNVYAQNLFVIDIVSGYTWTVVNNTIQNYDSLTAFTGIATGQQETVSGVTYDKINVTLPSSGDVNGSLDSDYQPQIDIE